MWPPYTLMGHDQWCYCLPSMKCCLIFAYVQAWAAACLSLDEWWGNGKTVFLVPLFPGSPCEWACRDVDSVMKRWHLCYDLIWMGRRCHILMWGDPAIGAFIQQLYNNNIFFLVQLVIFYRINILIPPCREHKPNLNICKSQLQLYHIILPEAAQYINTA